MRRWLALVVLCAGCGSSSPTSPSPTPVPPATFTGTVTDTVSGAPVAGVSATLSGSRVTISAPGYMTRETANAATVDLIPMAAPFDLAFYRQLARNALDLGSPDVIRVLSRAPAVYLQRTGLSDANVAALEQAARTVIPAMTGGKFALADWQTGETLRADAPGWITMELMSDAAQSCGFTVSIGAPAAHVRLNTATRCLRNGGISPAAFAHELGHALGLGHVDAPRALMRATLDDRLATDTSVSEQERYHAGIAYHRSAGNRDLDVDP